MKDITTKLLCAATLSAAVTAAFFGASAHAQTAKPAAAGASAPSATSAAAPAAAASAPAGAGKAAAPAPAPAPAILARVGDTVITYDDFAAAFNVAARNKFYHARAPEHEVAALQREVADQLVNRVLLLREARARGMKPDAAEVQKTIQGYDMRYGNSEPWKSSRATMLPPLQARLEEENLLAQIEAAARNVPKPTVQEVRAYYNANPEKFTEPEQLRVSVILRSVPPASPNTVWLQAFEEMQAIAERIKAGADFAAEARQHSKDQTREQGGDMGYLHTGMLPEGTEAIVQALQPGQVTNPMQILEGIALFKVTGRKPPKLNSFEAVQQRAHDLLARDRSDQAWSKLVADLRKKTPSQIDKSRFMPLAEQGGRPAAR